MIKTIEFSLTGNKIKPLKTAIEVISSFTEGVIPLLWNENGISVRDMDSSGAIFVLLEILKEEFDSFEFDQSLIIGLNIEDLKKVLSRSISPEDTISFALNEENNRFEIKFRKAKQKTKTYQLTVHNIDEENAAVAERVKSISLNTTVQLESGFFKTGLNDVLIAADKSAKHLGINVTKDYINFEINRGSEGMSALVEYFLVDNGNVISIDQKEETNENSLYDADYLEKLNKLDSIAESTTFAFAANNPIRIHFILSDNVEFFFICAPLEIEDDYDDD